MVCFVREIPIYYEEYGEGKPIFSIHGWPVDHRLMRSCLEPIFVQTQGYRRIYPDLPGMGRTPAAPWIHNSDDVLEILIEFINAVIGRENFLLVGESYGGKLSLGLIYKMSERIDGVFFLCAATDTFEIIQKCVPQKEVLWKSESLDLTEECQSLKEYMDMAVIATPEMYNKWKEDIQPALNIADMEFLSNHCDGEYGSDLEKAIRTITFNKPSCILTGRQDDVVGYLKAYELVEKFPRATYAVLDCAGHNLQIESEPLFQQFVKNWIWRIELTTRSE